MKPSRCVCGIKKNAGWRLRLTRPTGSRKKVGFVGRVSAAPPGVTYSDHRSRPASFALYSAASARAMISAPTGWTAGVKPSRCVCGIKKNAGWRLRLTRPTGSRKKVGFVGRVSAAPPGVTYSDHRSRPASFALYSAASARAMISAPTGWTAGVKPSRCVCGIKKNAGWRLRLTRPTGSRKKVGFVGRVSAAPPGVTYSDHRSRPASFALYSAASARAMISGPASPAV